MKESEDEMRVSLTRFRPLHLVLASVVYWVALAAVKLGTGIAQAWEVSRLPPGHATMSAGLTNLLLRVGIERDGATVWTGSASLGAIIGWVVGPPLLLALTWRWARETEAQAEALDASSGLATTGVGAPPLPPPSWTAGRAGEPDAAAEPERRRRGHGRDAS
jgi:hypothetical protein